MFRDPSINTYIEIKGEQYFFTEAPNAPGIVYAEVGRKAKVYRLVNKEKAYALKVFKPRYRNKSIVENTRRITRYQDVMGLSVANRIILTPEEHPHIIEANSSFTYAVLMPWIEGKSWFNFVTGKTALQREESLDLARALVRTVNELEKRDLAHCDLSSSNFIFSSNFLQVELIDIEDLFGEGLEEPQEKPAGTGGYAPAWIKSNGIWEAGADRYSVGILISEIIGWQFADIRNESKGETFFDEEEFGKKTQRYQIMADKLEVIHPELSTLFKTVWYAESIEECPRVEDWEKVLEKIKEPEDTKTDQTEAYQAVEQAIFEAEDLLAEGQVEVAIVQLEEIYRTSHRKAAESLGKALLERGRIKEQQGDLVGAKQDYQKGFSIVPEGGLKDELRLIITEAEQKISTPAMASHNKLDLKLAEFLKHRKKKILLGILAIVISFLLGRSSVSLQTLLPSFEQSVYFSSNRSGNFDIYLLSESQPLRITYSANGGGWDPVTSPQGFLYFTSDRTGKREIYCLYNSKADQVTFTPGSEESWSPFFVNNILHFVSNRSGKNEIWRIIEGKAQQVTYTPGEAISIRRR